MGIFDRKRYLQLYLPRSVDEDIKFIMKKEPRFKKKIDVIRNALGYYIEQKKY